MIKQDMIDRATVPSSTKKEITTAERIKAIVGGSIGNLVEWYDWYA